MEQVKTIHTAHPNKGQGWPLLDWMRLPAALLVVAIHTSPLSGVNTTADFIFTRVLGRLAVPLFFMITGFFWGIAAKGKKNIVASGLDICKKQIKMYGLAMLLYLPLNLYMGYFGKGFTPLQLVKDILWNGTFYHLWYFSALILGVGVAALLYRLLPGWIAVLAAVTLYIIGLGGDSYYTLISAFPWVKTVYGAVFSVFEYTRNGLFFAPLFIVLGLQFSKKTTQLHTAKVQVGFAALFMALFGGMMVEALWLRSYGPLRHDSMYLMLPLVMVALFALLMGSRGNPHPILRGFCAWLYILHPWAIVLVRAGTKALGIFAVVVGNSLVFYCAVLAVASLLSFIPLAIKRLSPNTNIGQPRAAAYIHLPALGHNVRQINACMQPGCKLMAVVKTNAYGHGAVQVARYLQKQGVHAYAVATIEEGMQLRRVGIKGLILIFGYTAPQRAFQLWAYRLTQTIVDAAYAKQLAAGHWYKVKAHIKVDTGMHRLGVPKQEIEAIAGIYNTKGLRVMGIYSHFSSADVQEDWGRQKTLQQTQDFFEVVDTLKNRGISPGDTHLQSTYGLFNYPQICCSYARVGLGIYGLAQAPQQKTKMHDSLRPVMTLESSVVSVRAVKEGEGVGYGGAYRCSKPNTIAAISIGYADGIPRNAQNLQVLLQGRRIPVVGRISMDQLCVLLDEDAKVKPGDRVVLIGGAKQQWLGAEEIAEAGQTITNEIVSCLGARIKRVYCKKQ
ncbi:MAG: alanine racemase [Oscillospiraceae bacterium]